MVLLPDVPPAPPVATVEGFCTPDSELEQPEAIAGTASPRIKSEVFIGVNLQLGRPTRRKLEQFAPGVAPP
jgi:hypothetical protein